MDYDYDLQVWMDKHGIIMDCGHSPNATAAGPCCNGRRYAGMTVDQARDAQSEREARCYNPNLMTPYTGGSHD